MTLVNESNFFSREEKTTIFLFVTALRVCFCAKGKKLHNFDYSDIKDFYRARLSELERGVEADAGRRDAEAAEGRRESERAARLARSEAERAAKERDRAAAEAAEAAGKVAR